MCVCFTFLTQEGTTYQPKTVAVINQKAGSCFLWLMVNLLYLKNMAKSRLAN